MLYQIVSNICVWAVFFICLGLSVCLIYYIIDSRQSYFIQRKGKVIQQPWIMYLSGYKWWFLVGLALLIILTIFLSFVLLGFF